MEEQERIENAKEYWKDPIRVLEYCQILFDRIHATSSSRILVDDEFGIMVGAFSTRSAERKINRILSGEAETEDTP